MNPTPSSYDILFELYARRGLDFDHYVRLHQQHGFAFATPDFFIMGRPVCRSWSMDDILDPALCAPRMMADAWYIHAMAGDTSRAWSVLPWPLGYIGFERHCDNVLRWIPTEVIRRFHPASPDECNLHATLSH